PGRALCRQFLPVEEAMLDAEGCLEKRLLRLELRYTIGPVGELQLAVAGTVGVDAMLREQRFHMLDGAALRVMEGPRRVEPELRNHLGGRELGGPMAAEAAIAARGAPAHGSGLEHRDVHAEVAGEPEPRIEAGVPAPDDGDVRLRRPRQRLGREPQ